jgi:hypothetical protein
MTPTVCDTTSWTSRAIRALSSAAARSSAVLARSSTALTSSRLVRRSWAMNQVAVMTARSRVTPSRPVVQVTNTAPPAITTAAAAEMRVGRSADTE